MSEQQRRVYVIVNPVSGEYSSDTVERLEEILRQTAIAEITNTQRLSSPVEQVPQREWHTLSPPTNIDSLIGDAKDKGYNYIIVVGGDGTVHGVVNSLRNHEDYMSSVRLALVPTGSGDDLCHNLGIHSVQQALELIASDLFNEDRYKAADVLRCAIPQNDYERAFINSADAGFGAHLIDFGNKRTGRIIRGALSTLQDLMHKFGIKGINLLEKWYEICVLPAFLSYRVPDFSISIDSRAYQRHHGAFLPICMNGKVAAGNLLLAEDADNSDGYLHFTMLHGIKYSLGGLLKVAALLGLAKNHDIKLFQDPQIMYTPAHQITQLPNLGAVGRALELDGELYLFNSPITKVVYSTLWPDSEQGYKVRILAAPRNSE